VKVVLGSVDALTEMPVITRDGFPDGFDNVTAPVAELGGSFAATESRFLGFGEIVGTVYGITPLPETGTLNTGAA
jgi:hypothetical protein